MMDKMDLVFKLAKEKAIRKSSELGNTATPWKDFTPDHLKYRLVQEIREWDKTRDIDELLDIINLAVFVYLAETERHANRSFEKYFAEILRPLVEREIVKAMNEMDTEFDFTALPRLFEGAG